MTDEEIHWLLGEIRDELKRRNAISAAFLNEYQNAIREPDEQVVSMAETKAWIDDMEYTLSGEEE